MKCILLLSGGQDSVTALVHLRHRVPGATIHCLTINYGQRHAVETQCAKAAARSYGDTHTLINLPDVFPAGSAMTDLSVPVLAEGNAVDASLPTTFLPGRNMLFLAVAAAHAVARKVQDIVIGVCQTDYSGYPDCRAEFVGSMEKTLNLAMGQLGMRIHTPLMNLTKAQTFTMAQEAYALSYVIEHTHTCYLGDRNLRHAWGYGCGKCPACLLRSKGYYEFFERSHVTQPA